ncbi:Niemann-Pick C1 protein [Fasciola hepatica]|uniref:Niemann-Pick C1 protein n=1 Tax=Fasciola hepatica TaxID=6192 RepID=A0A4E0RLU6_FASHE|nr:Niemann-Pick C1 protein [Fasciola hepatica]
MLRRCPACWANFRLLLCGMTCDPNQDTFIEPTINKNLVDRIKLYFTESVANSFYNSCKDVNYNNGRAIDVICAASPCTRDALFKALGGDRSPFPVEFIVTKSDINNSRKSFDVPAYRCNETVPRRVADAGGPPCSCIDCESSCIEPPAPPTPSPRVLVFGLDAWVFSGIVIFVGTVLIFAAYEIVSRVYRSRHTIPIQSDRPDDSRSFHFNQHGTAVEDQSPTNCIHRIRNWLEDTMSQGFSFLGRVIASHPLISLSVSAVVSAVLCAGLSLFTVTTNPVELWSAPTSRSRLEKNFFDKNFAPFYRTEQLIIRPVNQSFFRHMSLYPFSGDSLFGPALEKEFLVKVLDLQKQIEAISVESVRFKQNISLTDICFKPLEPDNMNCAITTPLEYFQGNRTRLDIEDFNDFDMVIADYLDHLLFCANAPMSVTSGEPDSTLSCLASSGIPVQPTLALGGFNGSKYNESTCVVLTFLVNNDPDPRSDHVKKAELWESAYIKHVQDWAQKHSNSVIVSFQAEVDLRVTLGMGGVLTVIVSVVASIGMWSYAGTPATLIIVEVIPFLVLAVGVDNIFILVHDFEFDEQDADAILCSEEHRLSCAAVEQSAIDLDGGDQVPLHPHENMTQTIRTIVATRMSRTLGRVGPSLLLTSAAESVAFFCGSLTSMPAVRAFALYAGVAILFNFLLQIFAFVALLALDARRRASMCLLFIGVTFPVISNPLPSIFFTVPHVRADSSVAPWLHRLIVNWFAPFLLSGWVRPIVVVISLAWLCFSIAIIPNWIEIGLDQRLAMPRDSYVLDFFNAMVTDLRVGPPVYFVVTGGHEYNSTTGQNDVCGGFGCPQKSLTGVISDASRISAYSWIDDYFDWIDPEGSPLCCRVYLNSTEHCPDDEPISKCRTCPVQLQNGRPSSSDFDRYLGYFLDQNPSPNCPKAGRAPYHVAVRRLSNQSIDATYFMTYHTVLQSPSDFIAALSNARVLANRVNEYWHGNESDWYPTNSPAPNSVFPYSVFYVYYEQYLAAVQDALVQIGICLGAILVVTFILLGMNVVATLMVLFGVVYILLSLLSLMALWNISLNAISLVNLVVTVGIAVEFCAHIIRAFVVSNEPTRLGRAKAALSDMGSSILRGITLTKLGGIVVLAFSKSRLFEIFYFRMYLGIIVFGALTGLVVVPVYLSYLGPSLNKVLSQKHRDRMTRYNVDCVPVKT